MMDKHTYNRNQTFKILKKLGAESPELRMRWADRSGGQYSQEEIDFLANMEFAVLYCARCGMTMMVGDKGGWEKLSGSTPDQEEHHFAIIYDDQNPVKSWVLCGDCFSHLLRFAP